MPRLWWMSSRTRSCNRGLNKPENVAAEDQLELVETSVRDQVVLAEDDVLAEGTVDDGAIVLGRVIVRKRGLASRLIVTLTVFAHGVQGENPVPGLAQGGVVQIGRVDAATIVEALLGQQDGHGIDLLPGGTSGVPDADERIGAEHGNDVPAEVRVEIGLPEHGCGVHGHGHEEALHAILGGQDAIPESVQVGDVLGLHECLDAPVEGRPGVIAEIVPVALENTVQDRLQAFSVLRAPR